MSDYHQPYVQDCDSDGNVRDARREPAKHSASTKPFPHLHKKPRDAASDSGYSSHTSNTVASSSHSQPAATARPPPQSSQTTAPKPSKPVITRSESQQNRPQPSRSDSISRPSPQCNHANCGKGHCVDKRSSDHQTNLPHRPAPQQPPQRSHSTQYPVQDSAHPAPYPQTTNYAGVPVPIPYYYGNVPPQGIYNAQQYGTTGSPSGYDRSSYMAQYQPANMDMSAMAAPMGTGSPRDPYGAYMPGHGMAMPPNNQAYYRPTYSARQPMPTTSGQELSTPATANSQPSQPPISARRRSVMPGAFPPEAVHYESGSESYSGSSGSEDEAKEERYQQERRRRRRDEEIERARRDLEDRAVMPPPPRPRERRPTLTHTRTTPVDTRRPSSREPHRRSRHSVPRVSSSEYVDPDRTARPNLDKRPSDRDVRRPSISHYPSGREKSSSISRDPRPAPQAYIVEDADGRTKVYASYEEAQAKASRLKERQQSDEAEAYQATHRGKAQAPTLTAESIKRTQTQQQQERRPGSHVSGSSKKSVASSSRTTSDTIQITRGDTTFSIPANTTLEVRQTENGETWVIGSGSPPRGKSYHGGSSKSSGSRVGRSRNGSDFGGRRRDTFTEDGYERAL